MPSNRDTPLSTLLSQALIAYTIELDNEFEHRFALAGGRARVVSLVMWSNFLRFVGDGIAVGELPGAAGLPKSRMLSTLGGMERWGYVFVGPDASGRPTTRRDGYGSARGLQNAWVVRPTPAGRKAAEVWSPLFDGIERRWEERFGSEEIVALRSTLQAIVGRIEVQLPEYLPIVGSANGMAMDLPLVPREASHDSGLHLSALLSQALLAYTLAYEHESELSLPVSADFVRVLDESGVLVRDLPQLSGVSKEATAMALTLLTRTGYIRVEGASAATKLARLTPSSQGIQERSARRHGEVEEHWDAHDVARLRSSLQSLLDHVELARGLEPYPDGWRASKQYATRTAALIQDPRAALPHYPMVLHRGGWPDGS